MSEQPGPGAIVPYVSPTAPSSSSAPTPSRPSSSSSLSSDLLVGGLIAAALLSGGSVHFHSSGGGLGTPARGTKRQAPTKTTPVKKPKIVSSWSTIHCHRPMQPPPIKPATPDAKSLAFKLGHDGWLHESDGVTMRVRNSPAPACDVPNWGTGTINSAVTPVKAARLLRIATTHQILCGAVPSAWPIVIDYEYSKGSEDTPFFRVSIEASRKSGETRVCLRTLKQETRKGDKPVILSYGNSCPDDASPGRHDVGLAVSNYLTDSQWHVFVVSHLLVVPADFV